MGYYTRFKLEFIPENVQLYDEIPEFDGEDSFEAKWHHHEKDCKRFSKENPYYLFVLTGEGEEAGDIWRKVFYNGELVWEWKLDHKIPDVPNHILELLLG